MKLLYTTLARVPGAKAHCSQIAQMSRAFINAGADFELITPARAELPGYKNKTIQGWYGFDIEIPLEKLPCIDYISGTPAGLPQKVYQWAFALMVWTYNRSLIKFLRNRKDEYILYSRDIHVFSRLIKLFPSVKKIIEIHLLELNPRSATYKTENMVFTNCNGLIVVTSLMKEMLIERGIDENKIVVEPNGVDKKNFPGGIEKEEARKKLDLPCTGKIVLFMGNFHALGVSRGLETIVQAAPSILDRYEDTVFLFVGGPMEYAEPYISMFREMSTPEKNYMFLGRQAYDQIHLWLAAADVLVHPIPSNPIYDNITSPLKVYEYMTSARPMVVSDLPALRDVLVDEKNALLAPPSNAEAFSDAIIRLFDDPALGERLALQAREDVQHKTWGARAKRIIEWIENLH